MHGWLDMEENGKCNVNKDPEKKDESSWPVLGRSLRRKVKKSGHKLNFPCWVIQSSNCPCLQCWEVVTTRFTNSVVVVMLLIFCLSSSLYLTQKILLYWLRFVKNR